MKTALQHPPVYQLHFYRPDVLLRLEQTSEKAGVRASRKAFTAVHEIRFTRNLAAAGFMPETYAWHPLAGLGSFTAAQWIQDGPWLLPGPQDKRRRETVLLRMLLVAGLIWLTLIGAFVLHVQFQG